MTCLLKGSVVIAKLSTPDKNLEICYRQTNVCCFVCHWIFWTKNQRIIMLSDVSVYQFLWLFWRFNFSSRRLVQNLEIPRLSRRVGSYVTVFVVRSFLLSKYSTWPEIMATPPMFDVQTNLVPHQSHFVLVKTSSTVLQFWNLSLLVKNVFSKPLFCLCTMFFHIISSTTNNACNGKTLHQNK